MAHLTRELLESILADFSAKKPEPLPDMLVMGQTAWDEWRESGAFRVEYRQHGIHHRYPFLVMGDKAIPVEVTDKVPSDMAYALKSDAGITRMLWSRPLISR